VCVYNNSHVTHLPGFIEQKVLGKGTYGQVFKARRISDGLSYAVKVVNLTPLNHREIADSVNEIRVMASFNSPFIIRFYESFCDNKRLYIVTEYSRLGDLSHLIERRKRQNRRFQENDIWRFLIQLLEGLRVLHSHGVVHRDLKSANILLSAPDLIKIADLGISTVLHSKQLARTQIGTPLYLAPEIWKNKRYDQKCDMWSLGILLYEMMTFSFPFTGKTQRELSRRICSGYFRMPQGYSEDLCGILRRLLQINPAFRPSVNDLLSLECIRSRMELIESCMKEGVKAEDESESLLSTIQVPSNMKNVNLPNPAYGKKATIVRPLEERMHLKSDAPLQKEIGKISSPELKMICDKDWWSPNKAGSSGESHNERAHEKTPGSKSAHNSKDIYELGQARARLFREMNPRFRRVRIR
jgi:NIMA (never in mitosis gene a)-related kinase